MMMLVRMNRLAPLGTSGNLSCDRKRRGTDDGSCTDTGTRDRVSSNVWAHGLHLVHLTSPHMDMEHAFGELPILAKHNGLGPHCGKGLRAWLDWPPAAYSICSCALCPTHSTLCPSPSAPTPCALLPLPLTPPLQPPWANGTPPMAGQPHCIWQTAVINPEGLYG